jgi:septum formation protein
VSHDSPLLLASASPRRREILQTLGVPHVVAPASVDETRKRGETPDRYLERIVGDKRDAARAVYDPKKHRGLLVADTSVIVDAGRGGGRGRVLGKPEDDADARSMIRALAGRAHEVHTRFCVFCARGEVAQTVRTKVYFRPLDEARIARYVATGEGRDKAGAYAIQGIGAALVKKIHGSYTNVVGLPACEVMLALEKLGLSP